MSVLQKTLSLLTGKPVTPKERPLKGLSERQLIELESEIGCQLFGPIPAGHRRDFFCLDESTWVWHEEWIDEETGKKRSSTTRYEAHENGVLKAQDGVNYRFIEGEELTNLAVAVRLYYEQVMRGVYKRDPITGQKLTDTPPATI
ncbi:hypothetical protein EYC58_01405 [Candidatus Saccharibacteria bacterium]|nr:MAG: hypothetical protein EYC58_01405 [Candidatus Saccharibacteria bacterium]